MWGVREEKIATNLDVALGCTGERVDDDRQNVRQWEVRRVRLPRSGLLVLEVYLRARWSIAIIAGSGRGRIGLVRLMGGFSTRDWANLVV